MTFSKPRREQTCGRAAHRAADTHQLSMRGYTMTCPLALLKGKHTRKSPQLHSSC